MRNMLLISLFFVSSVVMASNYPPDYCHQVASVDVFGPAVVSKVASGCMTPIYIIGYKKSGMFGARPVLEAVITATCKYDSDREAEFRETNTVTLGKEWHGTGFMSHAIRSYEFCGYSAYLVKLEIAFTPDRGEWDSRYGANYNFDFRGGNWTHQKFYATGDEVVEPVWNFIIGFMRD